MTGVFKRILDKHFDMQGRGEICIMYSQRRWAYLGVMLGIVGWICACAVHFYVLCSNFSHNTKLTERFVFMTSLSRPQPNNLFYNNRATILYESTWIKQSKNTLKVVTEVEAKVVINTSMDCNKLLLDVSFPWALWNVYCAVYFERPQEIGKNISIPQLKEFKRSSFKRCIRF